MSRRTLYLCLAVIGAVAPYVFFLQYFAREGLTGRFVHAMYANAAAGGISTDLLLSSAVFWIFLFFEGRRLGIGKPWLYVAINLLIGLSCALPLFLWVREGALARRGSP